MHGPGVWGRCAREVMGIGENAQGRMCEKPVCVHVEGSDTEGLGVCKESRDACVRRDVFCELILSGASIQGILWGMNACRWRWGWVWMGM